LNRLTTDLRGTVAENRQDLSNTVASLREATSALRGLARDLDSGRGVAGALLKDEEWRRSMAVTLQNLEAASSNVANYGLLFKPRKPKRN